MNLLVIITLQQRIVQGPGGIGICSRCGVDGLPLKKSQISSNLSPRRSRQSLLHTGFQRGWLYSDFPKKSAKKKTFGMFSVKTPTIYKLQFMTVYTSIVQCMHSREIVTPGRRPGTILVNNKYDMESIHLMGEISNSQFISKISPHFLYFNVLSKSNSR